MLLYVQVKISVHLKIKPIRAECAAERLLFVSNEGLHGIEWNGKKITDCDLEKNGNNIIKHL